MEPVSWPAYRQLAETGELARRARIAGSWLAHCQVCPRGCETPRDAGKAGFCHGGRLARVASYGPHHGEEDCLRGWRGSGTIFFSGCNLGCVFCQNWETSHENEGWSVSADQLAGIMLDLQNRGCHNLNWVTPSHVLPQILEALVIAAQAGLRLPIVYNSSGYETVPALQILDGIVDIYLPDFKFWRPEVARRLALAEDYPEVARRAIQEMHRQVGDLVLDHRGLARRGLLVRHLVLPNGLADTRLVAQWLARNLSGDTYLNLMSQYHPAGLVAPAGVVSERFADLGRTPSQHELRQAFADARAAGLHRFDTPAPGDADVG